jgi:hypothetical protein
MRRGRNRDGLDWGRRASRSTPRKAEDQPEKPRSPVGSDPMRFAE